MLTKEDVQNLLAIVNQSNIQGASAEYIVELKKKLLEIFKNFEKPAEKEEIQ